MVENGKWKKLEKEKAGKGKNWKREKLEKVENGKGRKWKGRKWKRKKMENKKVLTLCRDSDRILTTGKPAR